MIDATTFAHSYHALWELYAPACELFVRRLNLDGYERFDVPLHSGVSRGAAPCLLSTHSACLLDPSTLELAS